MLSGLLGYYSVGNSYDSVGLCSHIGVVGYDYDCHAFGVQLPEHLHHIDRSFAVECSGGLIGKNYCRVGYKCTGYGHALFLSARQLSGKMVSPVGKSHAVELLKCECVALAA